MESLDTTILNTAVPVVSQALNVAALSMKSVLASYTLSLAVFIPISGWMADRFGTRRVFASAIGFFTLGSVLSGFSSDIRLLVACRILQGCGGAMMVPSTLIKTDPLLLKIMDTASAQGRVRRAGSWVSHAAWRRGASRRLHPAGTSFLYVS
jgi:MFS family permease